MSFMWGKFTQLLVEFEWGRRGGECMYKPKGGAIPC
jgi:hypothetical protein